jgi:ABC-2 type transport system permease protein
VNNFLTLPLMFTSNAIFPVKTMPVWLQSIALVNPLTYAVTPMRVVATQGWMWNEIWVGLVILIGMAIASVMLAISQFNRSIS